MSTIQEVLDKLQKLKEKAAAAPDFQSLQKISGKVQRIRQKLTDQRGNRQLNNILDKIELLVSEKNKYFRQKIMKNSKKLINDQTTRNQQADRTLKYSKSAQNLKVITSKRGSDMSIVNGTHSQKPIVSSRSRKNFNDSYQIDKNTNKMKKQKSGYNIGNRDIHNSQQMSQFLQADSVSQIQQMQIKKKISRTSNQEGLSNIQKNNYNLQQDNEKTVVSPTKLTYKQENIEQKNRLNNQVDFLEQKLTYSFKQIEDLNKKVAALQTNKEKITKQLQQRNYQSPMSKNFMIKQESVVDQYSQKLRQKTFIIQDLKAKLQYFKSMNQQLKNRITNEQRRNQDYIEALKEQIKNLKRQVQRLKKENQNINTQIQDLEQKNQGLMGEIKKLVSKLQQQSKEKEKVRKSIAMSTATKTQQLQKQIAHLSSKCLQLSKLQLKLQQQHQEKSQLILLKQKLQSRIAELEDQSKKFQQERDNTQITMYKLSEENKFLKNELKVNIEAKQLIAQQLLQTKDKLQQQSRLSVLMEYQNDIKIKTKLNKLKEIKGLLNQLR